MWVTDISRITAVINAFLYQWQAQGISIAWKSLVYCGKKWELEMKQVEGHMLLGVLVGSWEDSFSQNNKRQICEAYVRRNMNLLLISFQLKKKKLATWVHPQLVTLFVSAPTLRRPGGVSWTMELGLGISIFNLAWSLAFPTALC